MAHLKVVFNDDETVIAPLTPRVEVAWEEHFGLSYGTTFTGDPQRTHWYYLAFVAVQRTDSPWADVEWDKFLDGLSAVTLETDAPLAETR